MARKGIKMGKRKFVPNDTTYTCKCGHKIPIPNYKEKAVCSWCGQLVFIDEKREFKYRLQENKNKLLSGREI